MNLINFSSSSFWKKTLITIAKTVTPIIKRKAEPVSDPLIKDSNLLLS